MLSAPGPSYGTVRKWFTNVQAWRAKRKRRALARWELERAKGKGWFVIRTALTYSLLTTALLDYIDDGFLGGTKFSAFLYDAISYSIIGIFIAQTGWSQKEKDYGNALREARLKSLSSDDTAAHRSGDNASL